MNWFSNLLPVIENNPVTPALQKAIGKAANSDAVQQVVHGPAGQLAQGNMSQILPSIIGNTPWQQQHPYHPTIAVGADIGATGETTGALPKASLQRQPTEMGSYTFNDRNAPEMKVKGTYTKPVMKPNPNPISAKRSIELPEIAQTRNNPKTPNLPAAPKAAEKETTNINSLTGSTDNTPTRTYPIESVSPSKDDVISAKDRNLQINQDDIKTPKDVAQINSTLNGYGIKGTKTQQLQSVYDTIGTLAKRAKNIIAGQGGTIAKEKLINNTITNMSNNAKNPIAPSDIPFTANAYIDSVYARAMGKNVTQNIAGSTPDEIPATVAADMKEIMNEDAKSTFGQPDPTTWNRAQATARHGRDAMNDILSTEYPKAKALNNDMFDLYRSQDDLSKGANKESDLAYKEVNTPKEPRNLGNKIIPQGAQNLFPGAGLTADVINAATNSKRGLKIAGGVGLLGTAIGTGIALPEIKNALDNKSKTNAQGTTQQNGGQISPHTGIITQPFSSIKPDSDGSYSLPQSAPDGQNQRHYMSAQEYNDQLAQIGQQHTFGTPQYNQAKTQLDAQHAQDQQQADEVFKGNNIKNFMDNATTYNADGNQLVSTFNSLPLGFWNGVSKAGSVRAYNDPKYASQLQQIDSFNNEFASAYQAVTGKEPTSNQLLSSANSLKQATTKYIAMMQFISGTYGKYVNPYLALTSGTGTQSVHGTPTNATSKVLPPVTNAVPAGMINTPASIPSADANLPAIQ